MADADYKTWQREQRLWWTDVLVTLVLLGTGIDDVGGGLTTVFASPWVTGTLAGMTPVCNMTWYDGGMLVADRSADDTVRLGVIAWGGARVSAGIVRFAVGFYRSYIYSTYLPLNMMYGGVVRLVIVTAILGEGVSMVAAGVLVEPRSRSLLLGWPAWTRLCTLGAALLASFFIYEQTPWYLAAHAGYPQPEPTIREARRGVFEPTEPVNGPRRGGLLRG